MKYGPKIMRNKWGEVQSRPSSICVENRYREDGTDEWFVTEDGYEFDIGDCLYNYYDGEWLIIESMDDIYHGWFNTTRPDSGNRGPAMNSVRLSRYKPER